MARHSSKYAGVSWHIGMEQYRATLRYQGKDVHLGYHADPELAAWAVDFASYLLVGTEPRRWHYKRGKPNFPPHLRPDFPCAIILKKLASSNLLPIDELRRRLTLFRESCARTESSH